MRQRSGRAQNPSPPNLNSLGSAARIEIQNDMGRLDLVRELGGNLIKCREVNTLEALDLVILVTVLQSCTRRQICFSREIERYDLIARRNAFLFQIILEGGHIVCPNAEDIQCLQAFHMRRCRPCSGAG